MQTAWWISLVGLLAVTGLRAQSPPSGNKLEVEARYLVDTQKQHDPRSVNFSAGKPLALGESVNLGFVHHDAVWIKVLLKNTGLHPTTTALSLPNFHLDTVLLFERNKTTLLGDETPSVGPVLGRIAFSVTVPAQQTDTFYLKIRKERSFVDFSVVCEEPEVLQQRTHQLLLAFAFFAGLVLVLVFINTVLWSQTKSNIYPRYVLTALGSLGYVSVTTGVGKFVLFPEWTGYSEIRIYIGFLWMMALAQFLNSFLNLKKHYPKGIRWLVRLNQVMLFLVVASTFLLWIPDSTATQWFVGVAYGLYLVLLVSYAFLVVRHIALDKETGWYSTLAFLPLMVWGFAFVFHSFGWIGWKPSPYELGAAALFESFLFGTVLARNYFRAFKNESELRLALLEEKKTSLRAIHQTQIRERTTLAHYLHDQFGGTLAALMHQGQEQSSSNWIRGMEQLSSDLRSIAHMIMPRSLEDGALIAALRNQLEIIQNQSGIELNFHTFDAPEYIAPAQAQNLYLIALELIQNATKHGKPTQIDVEFYGYPDRLVLQITDNGRGFDPSKQPDGFGLQTVRSRVSGFDGEMDLTSAPGEGTSVLIYLPLRLNTP